MNQEMQDLIGALGDNGFKLEEIVYNPNRGASATAKFSKDNVYYDDNAGNAVSGNTINVNVDYDVCLDHVHRRYDEDDEMIYDYNDNKAETYINALMRRRRTHGARSMRRSSSGSRSSRSRSKTKSRSQRGGTRRKC